MSELKPCPFCGGEGYVYGNEYAWVSCRRCLANTKGCKTKAEAIEAWNRRAGDGNG